MVRKVVVGLALLWAAASAEAAVVCQKKSGVLSVKETACQEQETQVDVPSLLGDLPTRVGSVETEVTPLPWTPASVGTRCLSGEEESTTPTSDPPYPAELEQGLVEVVRAGRNPEELEPTAQSIRNWVRQADRDDGRRQDGLTTEERQELHRLRREKSRGLVRSGDRLDSPEGFGFVTAHRATHPVTKLCRVLDVSASGYYARSTRPASARER